MSGPAFLFDLDSTLTYRVYVRVLAWQEALELTSSCVGKGGASRPEQRRLAGREGAGEEPDPTL
jgi:hypothetical protein